MRKIILLIPILLLASFSANKISAAKDNDMPEVTEAQRDELRELYDERLDILDARKDRMESRKDRLTKRLDKIKNRTKKIKRKKRRVGKMSDDEVRNQLMKQKRVLVRIQRFKERIEEKIEAWKEKMGKKAAALREKLREKMSPVLPQRQ